VDERNFEAALECPELVSAPDVQHQLAFRYRQINHWQAPLSSPSFTPSHYA
jgi:hypothetical protein